MKKLMTVLLALAMVLSLAACGGSSGNDASSGSSGGSSSGSDASESGSTIDASGTESGAITTITPGKLTVATSPDFAPYEFYAIGEDGKPQLAGFEMSLAQYIADYLGLELEIIPMDFDGTLMELQTKNVDLGMAGYSPNPKREKLMDFSEIFYTGGQSFATVKGREDEFPTLEATNDSKYAFGAQTGSIQVDLCQENSPEAELVQLPKVTDIIQDLLAGNLDGAYLETVVALQYAKNYPELAVVLEVPYDAAGSVVGVYKGNEALLKGVNEAIEKCLADGTMAEFVAQAGELASGETYEGLLDENGQVAG